MDAHQAQDLINKYSKGECTSEEEAIVEAWFLTELNKKGELLEEPDYKKKEAEIWEMISRKTKRQSLPVKIWYRVASVAAVLLMVAAGLFYYPHKEKHVPVQISQSADDINPGGNKAFLTLGDGKRIDLTSVKNGELAKQSGVKITKTSAGQLVYHAANLSPQTEKVKVYNTIETPNGGQYQIILPDGSKVWLNAASSLRFPASFTRLVNRKVELLSGEAYFEIAKDKKHPFIVKTHNQEVEVLGTHFNISAYEEEHAIRTTLLEGRVKVYANGVEKILKPNQQATLRGTKIEIEDVDAAYHIAWKNGYFLFNSESLESIMNTLSRWYNIEVLFKDPALKTRTFIGTISRFEKITKVLNMLERTEVASFEINGNKIIIDKRK